MGRYLACKNFRPQAYSGSCGERKKEELGEKESQKALLRWDSKKRRGGEREIEEKTARLKQLQAAESYQNVIEIRKVKEEVSKLLEQEDIRFKKVLAVIIEPTQCAFLPGRLISDNVMVAYELIHSMKTRKRGKVGNMAVKLDMSKAYDRIEWVFLEAVMKKLGFCERWTSLIMKCVSSVTYSVLINGQPGEKFSPSRGLRQGDLLSPYLLILCAEGLSYLLNNAERMGVIRGVKVIRGGTSINHLLFADNCILFGRATMEEWNRLQGILKVYEKASGQFLNKEKTSVFYSTNTPGVVKSSIFAAGNSVACGSYERYLGLPAVVGRSKFNTFRVLKDKIWQKIANWKNNFLLQAGKEVMIKVVLQAIPTYTMSVFKLPIKLCNEINSMFSKFWWGNHQKEGGFIGGNGKKWLARKGRGLWEKLLEGLDKNRLEEVVVQIRRVWLRRSTYVFENKLTCPRRLVSAATEALEEFKRANRRQGAVNQQDHRLISRARWVKPSAEFVKVNWDAFTDLKRRRMGMGVIMRDENAFPLLAKVIFEGDAKAIIEVVKNNEEDWSDIGPLIEDIRNVFSNRKDWFIQFDYRERNIVAHNLAKAALNFDEERVWLEEVPDCIVDSLEQDKICKN
ncbi:uncharacterized protein LOC122296793 [Carya illinoinensis]|uniref:uncharacterized protein LOC122296793 n=1 Tax=Carya illinoinensis TaxID=32201 RepID=UPI001C71E6D5|nr:uncharacterized protein LOC122296793 [Carya illinoinensis]